MVKIAVMVGSYAELQFEISEEINFKFQKNISPFFITQIVKMVKIAGMASSYKQVWLWS